LPAKTKVTAVIEQHGDSVNYQYIGFTVWKSDRRVTNPGVDQIVQSPITNSAKVESEFEAAPGRYVIMPCTFHPNVSLAYTLKIIPNVELNLVPDIQPIIFKGNWRADLSGGCKNNPTWKENPTFPINITKNQILTVILTTHEKKPIGFYIFDESFSNAVLTSKFANTMEMSSEVQLSPGKYVILPCTFNPNIYCDFEIRLIEN